MDRAEELRQWFAIAGQDLSSAEYLSNMRYPTPDEVICNLCQQAAEKYLKGYIFLNYIEPPKIHDLFVLIKLCESINGGFSVLIPQSDFLTQYGILPRYPNELQITGNDMRTAIQYAKDIKDFVESLRNIGKDGE
jgi:HEPN domain-containing protein